MQHSGVRLRAEPGQAVDPAGDGPHGAHPQAVHRRPHDEAAPDAAVGRRRHRKGKEGLAFLEPAADIPLILSSFIAWLTEEHSKWKIKK